MHNILHKENQLTRPDIIQIYPDSAVALLGTNSSNFELDKLSLLYNNFVFSTSTGDIHIELFATNRNDIVCSKILLQRCLERLDLRYPGIMHPKISENCRMPYFRLQLVCLPFKNLEQTDNNMNMAGFAEADRFEKEEISLIAINPKVKTKDLLAIIAHELTHIVDIYNNGRHDFGELLPFALASKLLGKYDFLSLNDEYINPQSQLNFFRKHVGPKLLKMLNIVNTKDLPLTSEELKYYFKQSSLVDRQLCTHFDYAVAASLVYELDKHFNDGKVDWHVLRMFAAMSNYHMSTKEANLLMNPRRIQTDILIRALHEGLGWRFMHIDKFLNQVFTNILPNNEN